MGANLLSTPDVLCDILTTLRAKLPPDVAVSAKIRLLPSQEDTLSLVRRIVSTGISCLTIHCRTKEMRKREPALIHRLREIVGCVESMGLGVPVIHNGDCSSRDDAVRLRDITGACRPCANFSAVFYKTRIDASDRSLINLSIPYLTGDISRNFSLLCFNGGSGAHSVMIATAAEKNLSCFAPGRLLVDAEKELIPTYIALVSGRLNIARLFSAILSRVRSILSKFLSSCPWVGAHVSDFLRVPILCRHVI